MVHCLKQTKRGFLPEIMESMYNDRVKYKNLMLKSKQEYENTKDKKTTQRDIKV